MNNEQHEGEMLDCYPALPRTKQTKDTYRAYQAEEDNRFDEPYRAIPNEIQEIAKQIEVLANVVEDLQIRLSPICKPVPEEITESGMPPLPCCPLAQDLRRKANLILDIRLKIESLLETIEL
jgi:hypothetical protein